MISFKFKYECSFYSLKQRHLHNGMKLLYNGMKLLSSSPILFPFVPFLFTTETAEQKTNDIVHYNVEYLLKK